MKQIDTEKQIKERWQEADVADQYEQKRYGNIKRSLTHWVECDAIEYFLKKYAPSPTGKFLDLACGTGRLTRSLVSRGFHIISCDYSREMLGAAIKKSVVERKHFYPVHADAFALPFEEEFAGVFTVRFIRHYKLEQRVLIYEQIRRVLKPNGILVFDVLNARVDSRAHERVLYDETYSFESIRQELAEHGFDLVEMTAGNIAGIPIVTIAKKWSLLTIGRSLASHYRSRKDVLDRAAHWMVAARKIT
jgi:ubiquinone/menaquinone biosynthesis C-methylase UbiE